MVQLVNPLTLGFGSGHDLRTLGKGVGMSLKLEP